MNTVITENKWAFAAITEQLTDVVEPQINRPENIKAIREKLIADFDQLVKDLQFDKPDPRPIAPELDLKTRLFRDLNPICDVMVRDEDVTVYDRVPVVNEDLVIE